MYNQMREAVRVVMKLQDDPSLSLENVVRRVSEEGQIPFEDLMGRSRRREIAPLRQAVYYLYSTKFDRCYAGIGRIMRRDHTTIINGVKKIKRELEKYTAELVQVDPR